MTLTVNDIQHELLYDHDNIVIVCEKQERREIQEFLSTINVQRGKKYDIKITRYREKRSLDANSYYWLLLGKMASVLGTSKIELHNQELGKYGAFLTDSDNKVLYTLFKASIDYLSYEQIHLKPTGKTEDRNGVTYMWFMVLKPTHEMDSKEMSVLIDGVVQDAKELGIETATPQQIAEMKALMGN